MKFLNLNTGYTFDGIWHDWMPWSDWTIEKFNTVTQCDTCGYVPTNDYRQYTTTDSIEYLFSYEQVNGDPTTDSTHWTNVFDPTKVKLIAHRTRVSQTKGYIFWFPGEQSTGITYTMPLCIITDKATPLTITIEDNNIFSFVNNYEGTIEIDGYTFGKPNYVKKIITKPQPINNKYAHVFNVLCCGYNAGEYICRINISDGSFKNDNKYIRVGADLYGEYEPTYVNLSNMGVELPDMIQKAIYDVNVHEDGKDNIIINRKLKELLSNYWDIIANKGSYKSLINALQWFEWNDVLKVKEIWKHYDANRVIFDDRDIMSLFESKINDSFIDFVKTTYVSLYCSLQEELPTYDSEMNPELTAAVFKWSREDIQLKLSLLSQFFSIYFMPIHMSILHATVEDLVFTNTIKSIHGANIKRNDQFGDFVNVKSNINDGDIFKITEASVQATSNTLFVCDDLSYDHLGIDKFPKTANVTENDLKVFATNYYTGPGVIIPIELQIPNQDNKDFIKQSIIDLDYKVNENGDLTTKRYYFYNVFNVRKNSIDINFNIIAKFAGLYALRFTFILASGKTITKRLAFEVEDTTNLSINIYKVCAKNDANGFTYSDFKDTTCSKYLFKVQNKNNDYYTQYLPYLPQSLLSNSKYANYKGVKLNRTVVFDVKEYDEDTLESLRNTMCKSFLEFAKYDANNITYLIYVSKRFYEDLPNFSNESNSSTSKFNPIRNDLGFYPQFHKLEKLTGTTVEDYTISQYDAICCAAEFNDGKNIIAFKYGNEITGSEWVFTNTSTGTIIEHQGSSRTPFIADNNHKALDPGYYSITFNYKLTNGNQYNCGSGPAFIIKHI